MVAKNIGILGRRVRKERHPEKLVHLCEIYGLERKFAETFTSIHIRFACSRNTSSTEFRPDTILEI
jgi:hypothetical protein